MRDEVIYAPLLHATDRYVCSLYSLTSALMYKPSQNNIEIAICLVLTQFDTGYT